MIEGRRHREQKSRSMLLHRNQLQDATVATHFEDESR